MPRSAEALEEFADEFEAYIAFVDETRETIHTTLTSLLDATFTGELATKFEDLVRADIHAKLVPLQEEFSADLAQLRDDVEFVRNLESGNVGF